MGKFSSNFDSIRAKITEKAAASNKSYAADERFYKFGFDKKTKIGTARIRFLPNPDDIQTGTPFIEYYSHWFDWVSGTTKGMYTKNCLTSINEDCPVCERNRTLYKGSERDKKVASARKRKYHAVANILVIKDSMNPENEGKVFLYDHGVQIHSMYEKLLFPPTANEDDEYSDGETKMENPFDLYGGRDFVIRSSLKENTKDWMTYDTSSFLKAAPIFPTLSEDDRDTEIEKILESAHSLSEWESPSKYPTAEATRAELAPILGRASADDYAAPDNTPDEVSAPTFSSQETDSGESDPELDSDPELGDESIESDDDYIANLVSQRS